LSPVAGQFDLSQAARMAIERAEARAELLQAQVRLRAPKSPVWVLGDAEHVARILDNLLNNALIYSPRMSRITVTVRAGDHPLVQVTDNGAGIPTREQEKIFDRFYRVDDSSLARVP